MKRTFFLLFSSIIVTTAYSQSLPGIHSAELNNEPYDSQSYGDGKVDVKSGDAQYLSDVSKDPLSESEVVSKELDFQIVSSSQKGHLRLTSLPVSYEIRITNSRGVEVYSKKGKRMTADIDLCHEPDGNYNIILISEGNSVSKKVYLK